MNIETGPGYRLLKEGEEIRRGDQCYCNGKWQDSIYMGTVTVGDLYYRRKIEPQEGGWFPLSEGLPTEFPCWMAFKSGSNTVVVASCMSAAKDRVTISYSTFHISEFSHWRPLEAPAPPPVEDPGERAFDDWFLNKRDRNIPTEFERMKASWKAGIEYQKQQK